MDITQAPRHIIRSSQDASRNTLLKTDCEIISEQYRIIKNWKPRSDVWPLTTGRGILIGAATISGIYINHRFRARLKLRNHGTFPTMLGLTLMTATASAFSHTQLILNKLFLLDIPCPLCIESRSALLQICSGLLLPLIATPVANFSVSAGTAAYSVPHITDGRKIFSTILSAYQPMFPKIVMIFTFHALLAGFITYLEIKSFMRIIDIQYIMKEEKKSKNLNKTT